VNRSGQIKITITAWYTPEPESYHYDGKDDLSLSEMVAQDEAMYLDEQVGEHDLLDWCDEFDVTFSVGTTEE
jgi:hypothetical protein